MKNKILKNISNNNHNRIKDCLSHLWFMISLKKRSVNTIEHREELHVEIVNYINFLANEYHLSNSILNYTFSLAEEYSHFEYYFNNIFKFEGTWVNDSYKFSITMG